MSASFVPISPEHSPCGGVHSNFIYSGSSRRALSMSGPVVLEPILDHAGISIDRGTRSCPRGNGRSGRHRCVVSHVVSFLGKPTEDTTVDSVSNAPRRHTGSNRHTHITPNSENSSSIQLVAHKMISPWYQLASHSDYIYFCCK